MKAKNTILQRSVIQALHCAVFTRDDLRSAYGCEGLKPEEIVILEQLLAKANDHVESLTRLNNILTSK